jgi:disulfide bond formation protein DsbB
VSAERVAIAVGCVSLGLVLGALGFQYLADMPPCEMCHWQRWPHIAAAIVGIVGGGLVRQKRIAPRHGLTIAVLAFALTSISGVIGAYQAGVEWGFLPGPAACTGGAVLLTGSLDLNHPVVRCDVAAWRLLGVSLAGYNALISLAAAGTATLLLARRRDS